MSGMSLAIGIAQNEVPWAIKALSYKLYTNLSSHLNVDQIKGSFKVSTLYHDQSTWFNYDFNGELPEIISHYLGLNLTFVVPTWNFSITSQQDYINSTLQLVKHHEIDYILNSVFYSQEIFVPQDIVYSTGIFGLHQISVLTAKEKLKKALFNKVRFVDRKVWIGLFVSIIICSFVTKWISKSKISVYQLTSSMLSVTLSQSSQFISKKINKNITLFCFMFSFLIFLMYFKALLLDEIMNEREEYCESMACFAQLEKQNIIIKDNIAYKAFGNQDHRNDPAYQAIIKNLEENFKKGVDIGVFFDIIEGRANLVADSYTNEKFFITTNYASDKNGWIITSMSDYSLQAELIRKSHPNSNAIRKKINECLEHGIIDGISQRTKQLFGLAVVALLYRIYYSEENIIDRLNYILRFEKEEIILLDDFKSIFIWLTCGCLVSITIFVLELFNRWIDNLLL
jgi:hypothetical protein